MQLLFAILTLSGLSFGQAPTILHSFAANASTSPNASLVEDSGGNFYGVTQNGGTAGVGTAFKLSSLGVKTILHSFGDGSVTNDAQIPSAGLVLGSDGNLYGTSTAGGSEDLGTVFKITTTGTVTILHHFGDGSVTNDGSVPECVLVQVSGGSLCGTTAGGGSEGVGALFKITTNGTVTLLHSFGTITNDGESPLAGVVLGSDGNLYGDTYLGGANSTGAVFKATTTGTVTILYSFGSSDTDPAYPLSALVAATDGKFYGTTLEGGTAESGTAFKLTSTGTLTILHNFGSSDTDGAFPYAGLVQAADGNFYGTTVGGGSAGSGMAFKITSTGTMTDIHDFGDGSVSDDAQAPMAALIAGADGKLYGTSSSGGTRGLGTDYSLTTSGTVNVLYNYGDLGAASDGTSPSTNLVLASDGNFYGTTVSGGASNQGTVFKMTPAGSETVLHSFADGSVSNDGQMPLGGLVQASDGSLYGTTSLGGAANYGTVFKVTTGGTVTILHNFSDGSVASDGKGPYAGLLLASNGYLYGTTSAGGSETNGTLFKINTTGTLTVLHNFSDGTVANDGQMPFGNLVQTSDGNIYGTTYYGGAGTDSLGTVFKLSSTGTVVILHSFGDGSVSNDGADPQAGLAIGSDGGLYGTTEYGGSETMGAVFKVTTGGTVTILHSFADGSVANDGNTPLGGLIQKSDGNFYGTTYYGGAGSDALGTLFKITPTGTLTILHSFGDGTVTDDGELPGAQLTVGSDGAAYGTTQSGGSTGLGTVFKY